MCRTTAQIATESREPWVSLLTSLPAKLLRMGVSACGKCGSVGEAPSDEACSAYRTMVVVHGIGISESMGIFYRLLMI